MNKIHKIYTVLFIVFMIIIFLPLEIAVYKGWKYILKDAINWNGKLYHMVNP